MNKREYYASIEKINETFKGKTIKSVEGLRVDSNECYLNFHNDEYIKIYHSQDCCETVSIEDINGNFNLEGAIFYEIIEKTYNGEALSEWDESYSWSFYTIITSIGYLDMRWYGTSNGYYSESVDFEINYIEEVE